MKNLRKKLGKKMRDCKKLISSFHGEKILLYTPLLKWYISKGLVVTKIHSVIEAKKNRPFKEFGDAVSNARREGDVDSSKAMIADMMKLVGNSAFGRTGMNKNKHTKVQYYDCIHKAKDKVNNWLFKDFNEIDNDGRITYVFHSGKSQLIKTSTFKSLLCVSNC